MEIIIRAEENGNFNVRDTLRKLIGDYWVKTYLPQIIQVAKSGETELNATVDICDNTSNIIAEFFSELGIKTFFRKSYRDSQLKLRHREINFSWD